MPRDRSTWLIAAAIALPLLFAAFTAHAWEDYFITLRSSRNLVEGHGLVFNPGERVHTFTSPLGVLVPALCTAIAGAGREELALWLFRALNAGLLGAAAWLAWRRAVGVGLGPIGRLTLMGLILADAKLTDFATNGMETGMLVFFLLLLWSELEQPARLRVHVAAVAVAGLMWTRPDAFVLGGAVILARIAFPGENAPPRRALLPLLVRAVLLGAVLYAPWFVGAWWYYGSPIPHTIVAKAAYTPPVTATSLVLLPWETLLGRSMLVDLFMPSYWTFGGWPTALKHLAHAMSAVAAFAWLVPALPIAARRASFAVFLGMFYLCSIILFPWYVPPWSVLAAIALAFTFDALHRGAIAGGRRVVASAVRVACLVVIAAQVAILVSTAWQMRAQQHFVENGVRRALGEWLQANAATGDTVFLEPLGYIGYFSQLKTFDFPGLSSPEVVAAIRGGARRYADVIERLKPDWVVLRPSEAARPEFTRKPVLRDYEFVRAWDALPQLRAIDLLPGREWTEAEAVFLLFQRKPSSSSALARPSD